MKIPAIEVVDPFRYFDQRELFVAAFRYYLGRRTIAVTFFARALAKAWSEIEEGTREIIVRELEEAFKRDDEMRADPICSKSYYPLGHDCDREAWEEVRKCYATRYVKAKCRWMYQDAHDEWTTDCGASFAASDFGCDEVKICPKCGRSTET